MYVANMHSTMMFFTSSGRLFWLKVYEIPEGSRTSKGRAIQNLLNIPDDKIKAIINVNDLGDPDYTESHYLMLFTKNGTMKKTTLTAYSHPRATGINAITVRDGDELLDVVLTDGKSQVFIAAREGRCCRFEEQEVRPMGRTAAGVRGINIAETDSVVGAIAYDSSAEDALAHSVLVVSENGYGKRTDFEEYRLTHRGGKGVKTINITDKTGRLVAIKNVTDEDDLMIINRSGLTIRMPVSGIRIAGRATQGVRLINIKDGDAIASVSVVSAAGDDATDEAGGADTATEETTTN